MRHLFEGGAPCLDLVDAPERRSRLNARARLRSAVLDDDARDGRKVLDLARALLDDPVGLDLDELETFPERVRAVTPNDIQRVARNFLRPDSLVIVLVGDASSFVDDLPGVGFEDYEVVPIARVDLYGSDSRPR